MAEIRLRTLIIILAIVLGPLLIWFLLDILIETDKEKIDAICEQMALATQAKDPDGMVRFIAGDYKFDSLTREDLRSLAEKYFEEYGDTAAAVTDTAVSVQKSIATAVVAVAIRPTRGEFSGMRLPTRWQLTFEPRLEETPGAKGGKVRRVWRIVRVEPLSVDRLALENWQQITERLGWSPHRPVTP